MNQRENLLRAVRFETPEAIPMVFHINPACWQHYPHDALQELVSAHPLLFPDFAPLAQVTPTFSPVQRRDEPYRDPWGCVWHTSEDGITGTVTEHPLADWKSFTKFRPPDILRKTRWGEDREDWDTIKRRLEEQKMKGVLATVRIPCFFDRLHYLRGFENLLCDFATDPPELSKLIEMVLEANLKLISKLLELGADLVDHHGDIGTQRALMMKPETFRKYLKPSYARMFQPFPKDPAAMAGVPPLICKPRQPRPALQSLRNGVQS